MSLLVVATGTNIGKTLVSSLLLSQGRKRSSALKYWKPIQTGTTVDSDLESLKTWTQEPDSAFLPNLYQFKVPASPHYAAERESSLVDTAVFWNHWQTQKHQKLLIEGAGGLMVPWTRQTLWIDLIALLQIPVLLVASNELGTLNHSLLSFEALQKRNIPCVGFLTVGKETNDLTLDNETTLQGFTQMPFWGNVQLPSQWIVHHEDFAKWNQENPLPEALLDKLY